MKIDVKENFHNWQDAENWRRGYLNAYPEPGYGTQLAVVPRKKNKGYRVLGFRFSTAD